MIRINPVEILKAIESSRRSRGDSVATYVRKVSSQADELADIWEEIASSLISGDQIDRDKLAELGVHKWIRKNNRPYFVIHEFYKNVSSSLGNNGGGEWVDAITYSLGSILYDRDIASNTLLKLLENNNDFFFLNEDNHARAINDLASSVGAIRSEAAALRVLADHVEASN